MIAVYTYMTTVPAIDLPAPNCLATEQQLSGVGSLQMLMATYCSTLRGTLRLVFHHCSLVASSAQMSREVAFCSLKFCGHCCSPQLCSTVLSHPSVLGGHEQKRFSSN